MKDAWSKYVELREQGLSARDVFGRGIDDGLDSAAQVLMIRSVFGLSLGQVKDIKARLAGWASASELEEQLARELEVLRRTDNEGNFRREDTEG